jgi:hypothetical protein
VNCVEVWENSERSVASLGKIDEIIDIHDISEGK